MEKFSVHFRVCRSDSRKPEVTNKVFEQSVMTNDLDAVPYNRVIDSLLYLFPNSFVQVNVLRNIY